MFPGFDDLPHRRFEFGLGPAGAKDFEERPPRTGVDHGVPVVEHHIFERGAGLVPRLLCAVEGPVQQHLGGLGDELKFAREVVQDCSARHPAASCTAVIEVCAYPSSSRALDHRRRQLPLGVWRSARLGFWFFARRTSSGLVHALDDGGVALLKHVPAHAHLGRKLAALDGEGRHDPALLDGLHASHPRIARLLNARLNPFLDLGKRGKRLEVGLIAGPRPLSDRLERLGVQRDQSDEVRASIANHDGLVDSLDALDVVLELVRSDVLAAPR